MIDIRQRRFEKAVRREDLREEIVFLRGGYRAQQVELAVRFDEIETSALYVYEGCSSIRQFGERYGFSAFESITLRDAGKAMRLCPEARLRFLAGKISLDALASLAEVLSDEQMMQAGDDWLDKAERLSIKAFRREIRHRLAEVKNDGPVSRLTADLTAEGQDKFERAVDLASEKEGKALTAGETIEVLSDHYLDSFDVDEKEGRARRTPDTNGQPGRYVPAEVQRRIRTRATISGVVYCEFPDCDNRRHLEFCHLQAHAEGGSREYDNLWYGCPVHHAEYDGGLIDIRGPPDARRFYIYINEMWFLVRDRRRVTPNSPPLSTLSSLAPRLV